MAEAVNATNRVLITQSQSSLSHCVGRVFHGCLCSVLETPELGLSVLSCSRAEDDIQKV